MNFDQYAEEFEKAVAISNAWNLNVDTSDSRILSHADLEITDRSVQATIAMQGLKGFTLQCGATHATQRYLIRQQDASINPIITIGWVDFQGERIFQTNRRTLKREIKKQKKRRTYDTLDYHAWLTVRDRDSIQIIDCTVGYYLYRKGRVPEPRIWVFDDESPEEGHRGVQFHPILAGQKTLEALNVLDEDWQPTVGQLIAGED